MKQIAILILPIFLLTSCFWGEVKEEKSSEKTEFLLEIKNSSTLEKNYFLEKSSKIEASTSVDILSETSGRVERIAVKEWENVISWQPLVYFYDNSGNINTNYKQAILNLETAKIQYENNKVSLDKAIFDSEMNLEKLKNNFENTKKSFDQDLKQAKNNLENSDVNLKDSKSSLDIQKIDNSISKMEFDLETNKKANKDKIDAFILSLNQEKNNLKNLYVNVINFWDELYSVKNPNLKPSFYDFLWASSQLQKSEAENTLKKLMEYEKDFLKNISLKDEKEIWEFLQKMDESYLNLKIFLDASLVTLNNSLTWLSGFSEGQKQAFTSQVNGYISSYTWSYTSFINQKSNITTFLNTYKDSEESIKKQIELAKKDKEIAIKSFSSGELSSKVNYDKLEISISDTITNMELQIKNAEVTLDNAKKTRDITLRNLENSIKNAELAVEKAGIEAGKLVVKAPISGQISKIDATEGQTYWPSSKVLTLISSSKRELDVFVNSEDLWKINVKDKVKIEYRWENFEWEIFSKSNVADETLNYKVKVALNKEINLVWWVANVSFILSSEFPLLPINSVTVLHSESDKKLGEINILKDGKIEKMEVELGEVFGKNIEIKTELPENLQIILNDVVNFDEDKFELKVK